MKEQIIQLPDNFEVKEIKDGKIILVEKEKKLTYEYIAEELFSKPSFFIGVFGSIESANCLSVTATDLTNCTSKRQAEKLLAINKLMNVAKYLNGDWQPDWKNRDEDKIFIYIDHLYKNIKFGRSGIHQSLEIYFKSEELARQAIDILGEETIKLALCTDY